MWRTHRDPQQRYNPRPYPSAARPKIVLSPRQAHRNRGASRAKLFAQDPPPNYKPNLFGAFHFQSKPHTRPNTECNTPVNTPVTPVESVLDTPRTVRSPARPPKVSTPPKLTPRKPSLQIPGAFPQYEEPAAGPSSPNENIPPAPAPVPAPEPVKGDAKQDRRKRRREPDDELGRLRKSVRQEFGEGPLDEDELFLMKQLNALHMDAIYRTTLFNGQQVVERAAKSTQKRVKNRRERDAKVREVIAKEEAEAENKRQKRVAAEAKRKRAMERFERERQEIKRKEREAQRKLAADNLEREKLRRWVEDLAEQGQRRERERKQRESHVREEAERLAREREDEYRRMQETIRRARQLFSDGDSASIQRQFGEYEAKWAELKEGRELPPLSFEILPWPVLGLPAYDPSDITLARVEEFVFHPLRSGLEMKSRRDRVRAEILRWHPDKFNAKVLGKVIRPDFVSEGAGVVARFLNEIMERETNKEKGC